MFTAKYIVQNNPINMFVFDRYEKHETFAARMGLSRSQIRSAGTVFFKPYYDGNKVCVCSGESVSLGIKADEQADKQLFEETFLTLV